MRKEFRGEASWWFISMSGVGRLVSDVFCMTARPMYRWKSFWLGVVVLAFLGWAWVRSMDRIDAVDLRCSDLSRRLGMESIQGISMSHVGGELRISRPNNDPFAEDGLGYWSTRTDELVALPVLVGPDEAGDPLAPNPSSEPRDPFAPDESSEVRDPFARDESSDASDPFAPSAMHAEVAEKDGGLFPGALAIDGSGVVVADWLLCLMFFLAWSGWLVWRWRRARNLTDSKKEVAR